MAAKNAHQYEITTVWDAASSGTTQDYRSYSRDHQILFEGKPALAASADPNFRGDGARYNPEELLVAALSSCHMLWYLHLCALNKIEVLTYRDRATGFLEEHSGAGRFREVVLRPAVTIAKGSNPDQARALHARAHQECFIANSVKTEVITEPFH